MISLSYALNRREGKLGSPEKPLSDLGKLSYRSYWAWIVLNALRDYDGSCTIREVAQNSGVAVEDVVSTLHRLDMLRDWKGQLLVRADRDDIAAKIAATRRPPRLCDDALVDWSPPPPGGEPPPSANNGCPV